MSNPQMFEKVIHAPTNIEGVIYSVANRYDCYKRTVVTVAKVIYVDGYECWTDVDELRRL